MKYCLLLLSFFCAKALASDVLEPSKFLSMYDDLESIESADRVFSDEFAEEDVYKVTFTYEEWDCAPAPTPSGDACGPTGKMLTECLYVKVDTSSDEIHPTEFTCDTDLEDVVDVTLIDEL